MTHYLEKGESVTSVIYDPQKKKQQLEACIMKAAKDLSIISGD